MGTVSLTDPVNGTVADADLIANNNAALETAINGGIDASNFAAGKILAPSKLTQESALAGELMVWNQTAGQWEPATTSTVRVYRNTDQTMSGNNTEDVINFTHERLDTDNMWAASPNAGRLIAPRAGLYVVGATTQFTNPSSNWVVSLALRANGTFYFARQMEQLVEMAPNPWLNVSGLIPLAAAEYVQVMVIHNHSSGATLRASTATEDRCSAFMYRLPGSV